MRTQEERRHLETVAVDRQVKIGKAMGIIAKGSEEERQPHRLAKKHASNIVANAVNAHSNPRRLSSKAHEKLTVQELSASEAERRIEACDLLDKDGAFVPSANHLC